MYNVQYNTIVMYCILYFVIKCATINPSVISCDHLRNVAAHATYKERTFQINKKAWYLTALVLLLSEF